MRRFYPALSWKLGISASLFRGNDLWDPIYVDRDPSIVPFELVHGVERRRKQHNERSAARARREGRSIVSEHAGFFDLFVPVGDGGVHGTLVAGPFSLSRPTADEMGQRWQNLSGRGARLSDPEFARYAAVTLATPTLAGGSLSAFQRLCECLAGLLMGVDGFEILANEGDALRRKLLETKQAERAWNHVHLMLDEGSWREWLGSYRSHALQLMGVRRLPEHVLVGLFVGTDQNADPLDELIRRDAFQRACVPLARSRGTLCGRIADHGIALLLDDPAKGVRLRAKLVELSNRVAAFGRRFGFRLHFGASLPVEPFNLPERYQAALAASERALSRGARLEFAEGRITGSLTSPLGDLRRGCALAVGDGPRVLVARFERYLEAAAVHAGYDVDATRAHLEAGMDQVMDPLRTTGALDEKSVRELRLSLERASASATTVNELSQAYRKVIVQIERSVEHPTEAQRDRNLTRAIDFIQDHFSEPLSLGGVARVAGFAPTYFSKLFAKSEKMTFRDYVHRLRIDRAKHMLTTTTLSAERVGQLCGFRTRHRFHAIFRQLEETTPQKYREQVARR